MFNYTIYRWEINREPRTCTYIHVHFTYVIMHIIYIRAPFTETQELERIIQKERKKRNKSENQLQKWKNEENRIKYNAQIGIQYKHW